MSRRYGSPNRVAERLREACDDRRHRHPPTRQRKCEVVRKRSAYAADPVVSEFMTGGPWKLNDMTPFITQATVITISVYALYAFVLY